MFQWSLKSWWKNRNDRVEIMGRTEGISSNRLFPTHGFHTRRKSLSNGIAREKGVSVTLAGEIIPAYVYPSLAWLKLLKFRAVSSRTAVESKARPSFRSAPVSPKRYFSYLPNHFSRSEQNELDRENPCAPIAITYLLKIK